MVVKRYCDRCEKHSEEYGTFYLSTFGYDHPDNALLRHISGDKAAKIQKKFGTFLKKIEICPECLTDILECMLKKVTPREEEKSSPIQSKQEVKNAV